MKIFKYLLAALVIALAVTAIVLHLQREALALKIANSILADSDFIVSDLSIRTLNANTLHFSKLVLEQSDGARYEFRDLDLPLALPSTTVTEASIGSMSVEFGPATGEPIEISDMLDLLFDLPVRFPGIGVTIDDVGIPNLPEISALKWQSATDSQTLAFRALERQFRVTTRALRDDSNRLAISAQGNDGGRDVDAELAFTQQGGGYSATGPVTLDAAGILNMLERFGTLAEQEPLKVEGEFRADITAAIDTDTVPGVVISAAVVPLGEPLVEYESPDASIAARTAGASRYDIVAAWPAIEWHVAAEPFTVQADYGDVHNMAVQVSQLTCNSAAQCTFTAGARLADVVVGDLRAQRITLAGNVTATLAGAVVVTATPLSIDVAGLAGDGWSIGQLKMTDAKDFTVIVTDTGFAASARSLSVDLQDARYGADMQATLPLTVTDLDYSTSTGQLSAGASVASEAARLHWQDANLPAPAIDARIALQQGLGKIATKITAPARGLDIDFDLQILSTGMKVDLHGADVSFDRQPLSAWLRNWPYEWDLAAGRATATGTLELGGTGDARGISGRIDVVGKDLAGLYNDVAATGIQATVPVTLGRSPAIDIDGASIQMALVDVGLPIEDLAASVSWNDESQLARISGLDMKLLGGRADADPFDFRTDTMSGNLLLSFADIQLALIAALADFEAIEVSGVLSGTVPVQIDDAAVTVSDGFLESEEPGGVIRYRSSTAAANDTLGLASKALSNLQYESLTSAVSYTKNGDLMLKMRIKGINPDLDPLQPVILNLGVDNNIPQLLRSLQATRDIEEIIESRSRKK